MKKMPRPTRKIKGVGGNSNSSSSNNNTTTLNEKYGGYGLITGVVPYCVSAGKYIWANRVKIAGAGSVVLETAGTIMTGEMPRIEGESTSILGIGITPPLYNINTSGTSSDNSTDISSSSSASSSSSEREFLLKGAERKQELRGMNNNASSSSNNSSRYYSKTGEGSRYLSMVEKESSGSSSSSSSVMKVQELDGSKRYSEKFRSSSSIYDEKEEGGGITLHEMLVGMSPAIERDPVKDKGLLGALLYYLSENNHTDIGGKEKEQEYTTNLNSAIYLMNVLSSRYPEEFTQDQAQMLTGKLTRWSGHLQKGYPDEQEEILRWQTEADAYLYNIKKNIQPDSAIKADEGKMREFERKSKGTTSEIAHKMKQIRREHARILSTPLFPGNEGQNETSEYLSERDKVEYIERKQREYLEELRRKNQIPLAIQDLEKMIEKETERIKAWQEQCDSIILRIQGQIRYILEVIIPRIEKQISATKELIVKLKNAIWESRGAKIGILMGCVTGGIMLWKANILTWSNISSVYRYLFPKIVSTLNIGKPKPERAVIGFLSAIGKYLKETMKP